MGKTEKIVEAILWFSKKTDRFINEEQIKNFDLEDFRDIFNQSEEEDYYMCGGMYPVLKQHVERIQRYIEHKINLEKYDYFFSSYIDNT